MRTHLTSVIEALYCHEADGELDLDKEWSPDELDALGRLLEPLVASEWSGHPDPEDPDNYWIDDATGERVSALTGERTLPPSALLIVTAQLDPDYLALNHYNTSGHLRKVVS